LKEHQRALQYFERSLELRRASDSINRAAGTFSNIGDVYLEIGDTAKAFEYHQRSLEVRRAIGEKPGVANSLKNLGLVYASMKKPAESRRHFNEALDAARQLKDRTTEAQALIGLAALERGLGRGAEAARLASMALGLARSAASRELERRALEQLAAAEEAAGRPAAALAAFKTLKALESRIFADDKALRIDMLERRYQAGKHAAENEKLRALQEVSALQASRSRLQRNAIAGAGVLMLAIGVILYRRRVDAARLASELSVTDALTGLKNRRFVQQTIEADAASAVRRARTDPDGGLVFILLDVDHFKTVNDTHGHKAGDAILAGMAAVLRATCRASDTIARWGGEEFLIVCRATPPRDGAVLAERIRAAVEAQTFANGLTVTRSIGLAALPFEGRELTWEQAVALADRALYESKRAGRNRWTDARHLPHEATLPIASVATATAESARA
jgi:diguanylate cyclase (GGDEF)-like protein